MAGGNSYETHLWYSSIISIFFVPISSSSSLKSASFAVSPSSIPPCGNCQAFSTSVLDAINISHVWGYFADNTIAATLGLNFFVSLLIVILVNSLIPVWMLIGFSLPLYAMYFLTRKDYWRLVNNMDAIEDEEIYLKKGEEND